MIQYLAYTNQGSHSLSVNFCESNCYAYKCRLLVALFERLCGSQLHAQQSRCYTPSQIAQPNLHKMTTAVKNKIVYGQSADLLLFVRKLVLLTSRLSSSQKLLVFMYCSQTLKLSQPRNSKEIVSKYKFILHINFYKTSFTIFLI